MAEVGGNEGAFAWSGVTMVLNSADGFIWTQEVELRDEENTPFGWFGVRRGGTLRDGQGTLEYTIASDTGGTPAAVAGKPPIPDGSTGQLTLTTYAGQTRVFTAILTRMQQTANAYTAEPQKVRYLWRFAAAHNLEIPDTDDATLGGGTPFAELQYQGYQARRDFDDPGGVLIYYVQNLSGTADPNEALNTLPFALGAPWPFGTIGGCICDSQTVIARTGPRTAWVQALFRTARWGAAPGRVSQYDVGGQPPITYPRWIKYTFPGSSHPYYDDQSFPYMRSKTIRLESKPLTSLSPAELAAIEANVDHLYVIEGRSYIFKGANARTSQHGRGFVTYRFESTAFVLGTPNTGNPVTVPVPDLPPLAEWRFNLFSAGSEPTWITVQVAADRYPPGSPLP